MSTATFLLLFCAFLLVVVAVLAMGVFTSVRNASKARRESVGAPELADALRKLEALRRAEGEYQSVAPETRRAAELMTKPGPYR